MTTQKMTFTYYHKFSAKLNGKRVTMPDQITRPEFYSLKKFTVIAMDGTKITITKKGK